MMKTSLAILLLIGLGLPVLWTAQCGAVADDGFDPAVTAKAQSSTGASNAASGSLFPTPVLLVTPATLEFGPVVTNRTATNTFLVENVGRGKVTGKAIVTPPFKIVDGGSYSLTRKEKQVVTIVYAPKVLTGSNDIASVTFSGAGVAKATVIGTPVKPKRVSESQGQ